MAHGHPTGDRLRGTDLTGKSAKIGVIDGDTLKTTDLSDRELQEQILVELKLISLKLNCFQLDEMTVDDLEK